MRKLGKKLFKSIKTRVIVFFLLTTVLTSATSILILGLSSNTIEKMDDMFSANVELEEFLNDMRKVNTQLTDYLVTDDSDSLLNYYFYRDAFTEKANKLFDESQGIYNQDDLIYKDIAYMVKSFVEETDKAAEAKSINDADEYMARYAEATKISGYIQTWTDKLNLSILDVNTAQYLSMSEDLKNLRTANLVLLLSVIGLNVMVISYLVYNMTKPIIKLAHSAEEMSKGNFDADDVVVHSEDELSIMANAFNTMKHSIRKYIDELHNKADTESMLLEQQIENLKIQSLLANAEMKALQMQINPHFLFNTLNAGVQLATLEGAERTANFLHDIAKIFRYNVKSLDRKVKIKDEIDTVRAYSNLFQVRFGDIIKFDYSIDLSLLNIDVPPLIIQPLVENAVIHGIGEKESGGEVYISLERGEKGVYISVQDNGVGMSEDTVQKILRCHEFESEKSGHTTGIGLYNVVQRLRLFFDCEDVIAVESEPGKGTKVTLIIPFPKDMAN